MVICAAFHPRCWCLLVAATFMQLCYGQFSGSIQGDPSGAVLPRVTVRLLNTPTTRYMADQPAAPGRWPKCGEEGNEKSNQFREPNFAETDAAFYKDNHLTERINLQLRFEFYNIFNHPNLTNVDANPVDATFGKALSSSFREGGRWELKSCFRMARLGARNEKGKT